MLTYKHKKSIFELKIKMKNLNLKIVLTIKCMYYNVRLKCSFSFKNKENHIIVYNNFKHE